VARAGRDPRRSARRDRRRHRTRPARPVGHRVGRAVSACRRRAGRAAAQRHRRSSARAPERGVTSARIPRRAFLAAILAAGAARTAIAADESDLAPFDDLMITFLKNEQPPGAELAVANHGHLVYARGFGVTAHHGSDAVQPTALFRIASISKPITAVAILQLVERGRLSLDAGVWDLL